LTATPPGKSKALPITLGIVAVLVVIGLVNKGDDNDATNTSSPAPTSVRAQHAQPEPTPQPPAEPQVDTGVATEAVVPNVVGMNHQLAQDTLQAAGFYLLLEEDATGQGRQLVWDRNWEVVSQSVPGGTTASIASPITLFSKKIGE
jgi:PASTA domain-containing protein